MNFIVCTVLIALLSCNAASCLRLSYQDLEYQLDSDFEYSQYTMPESCKGQTYCLVKGDDYPDEQDILDVLKTSGLFDRPVNTEQEVDQRQGNPSSSECSTYYENAPIYYILDEQNRTRAVVQSEQYYLQKYEIRKCTDEGPKESTRNILKTTINTFNVKLACETTYTLLDFQVISMGNSLTMEIAKAKIPVCCKCRYEKL